METINFKGGLKLPVALNGAGSPLAIVAPNREMIIPMKQDLGPECRPVVKKRQLVRAGEVVGRSPLEHGADVHAPVSGEVVDVTRSFVHFSGKRMSAVVIAGDGAPGGSPRLEGNGLLDTLRLAGMVDYDKDTVPLSVKLDEARLNHVDSLIVNAMDIEPFFSSRFRVLMERLDQVLEGINTVREFLIIDQVFVVLDQDNFALLNDQQQRRLRDVNLLPLKYKYPQAIDYLLVKAVLGKEVMCTIPCRDLMHSQDIDGLVLSVETLAELGAGLVSTERAITVRDLSGRLLKNVRVQIGTPIKDVLNACSFELHPEARLVAGGPMTGQTLASSGMPVTKDLQGIFILDRDQVFQQEPRACIKCGLCADVCPARLIPFMISGSIERAEYDRAQKYQISSCFECGCCSYVCPSNIPLLHWIQFGKFEIFKLRSRL